MPSQFFIQRNGKVIGPLSPDAVKDRIGSGKIRATDQIGSASAGPWKPITDVRGLAKLFDPPPKRSTGNLTECEDCGGSMSKRAETCPHCGAPTAAQHLDEPESLDYAYGEDAYVGEASQLPPRIRKRKKAAEEALPLPVEARKEKTSSSHFPTVRKVSNNEVVISAGVNRSFDLAIQAMETIGKMKQQDRENQFIVGRIRYGLQHVKTRVSFVERNQGKTAVVIQASSDDVWNAGGKSAAKRLVNSLLNIDNPGYKSDRLGMSPGALVGAICLFFLLWGAGMKWLGQMGIGPFK